MQPLAALFAVLLVGGLGTLFTAWALAIRRDVNERFARIEERLLRESEALLRNLPIEQ